MTDFARFSSNYDLISQGWKPEFSGPVTWALTPFDEEPEPPRRLEDLVRKRQFELAETLRHLRDNQLESVRVSLVAADDYVSYAMEVGAPYFVEFFGRLQKQLRDQLQK